MFAKEEKIIHHLWKNKELIHRIENIKLIDKIILLLDEGKIRVAEKKENSWITNSWIKKAILLYFSIKKNKKILCGDIEFFDKIPLKKDFEKKRGSFSTIINFKIWFIYSKKCYPNAIICEYRGIY